MKLVKESIAFERKKDPKKALGLSIFMPQTFETFEEFLNFMISALPAIFGGKIPNDIISTLRESHCIRDKYYVQMLDFLNETQKIYKIRGEEKTDWDESNDMEYNWWPCHLKHALMKLGYSEFAEIIDEAVSFQKTRNPKSTLLGWQMGQICAIRETEYIKVKIYAGETENHPIYDTYLYSLGRIEYFDTKRFLFELNKHFRENRQAFGKTISNKSELSYLTKEEIIEVKRVLNLPETERWIQIFKEKTGITPFF